MAATIDRLGCWRLCKQCQGCLSGAPIERRRFRKCSPRGHIRCFRSYISANKMFGNIFNLPDLTDRVKNLANQFGSNAEWAIYEKWTAVEDQIHHFSALKVAPSIMLFAGVGNKFTYTDDHGAANPSDGLRARVLTSITKHRRVSDSRRPVDLRRCPSDVDKWAHGERLGDL